MRSRGKPTGENLSSFVDVKTNWKIDRGIKVKINNKLNPGEFEASAYSVLIFAKIGQFLFIFSFLQFSYVQSFYGNWLSTNIPKLNVVSKKLLITCFKL